MATGTVGHLALQLPARRIDVLAAGAAHHRLHARVQQEGLEIANHRFVRALVLGARERVEGNQVHLGRQAAHQLDELLRQHRRVVDAAHQGVFEGDGGARLARRVTRTGVSSSSMPQRLLSGTSCVRNSSLGACSDTASDTSATSPSLSIIGTTPAVESVTRLDASPKPRSSRIRLIALTTLSKFSSGSPMPIITTLVMRRCWWVTLPSCFAACHTCPMISEAARLRLKPCVPVEQNVQLRPQPICEDTHSVPRVGSGMYTVSIALPPSMPSNHLWVPSLEALSSKALGGPTYADPVSLARSDLPRSVIASKLSSRRWWIHFITWSARYGFSPSCAKNSRSSLRSRPSRFVFALAVIWFI